MESIYLLIFCLAVVDPIVAAPSKCSTTVSANSGSVSFYATSGMTFAIFISSDAERYSFPKAYPIFSAVYSRRVLAAVRLFQVAVPLAQRCPTALPASRAHLAIPSVETTAAVPFALVPVLHCAAVRLFFSKWEALLGMQRYGSQNFSIDDRVLYHAPYNLHSCNHSMIRVILSSP